MGLGVQDSDPEARGPISEWSNESGNHEEHRRGTLPDTSDERGGQLQNSYNGDPTLQRGGTDHSYDLPAEQESTRTWRNTSRSPKGNSTCMPADTAKHV